MNIQATGELSRTLGPNWLEVPSMHTIKFREGLRGSPAPDPLCCVSEPKHLQFPEGIFEISSMKSSSRAQGFTISWCGVKVCLVATSYL